MRSATFFLPIEPKSRVLCLATPWRCPPNDSVQSGLLPHLTIFEFSSCISPQYTPFTPNAWHVRAGRGNAWVTLAFVYLVHLLMFVVFTACHACAMLPSPVKFSPFIMGFRSCDSPWDLELRGIGPGWMLGMNANSLRSPLCPPLSTRMSLDVPWKDTRLTRVFSGNNNKVHARAHSPLLWSLRVSACLLLCGVDVRMGTTVPTTTTHSGTDPFAVPRRS
jgi:hypothetical protein